VDVSWEHAVDWLCTAYCTAADLLLWARHAGDIDPLLHGLAGAQLQQQRAARAVTRCQRAYVADYKLVSK